MEVRPNKILYKVELILLKVIPILLALFYALNILLSYFHVDCQFISIIAGVSVIPLIFLYISSYVFKYCEYHRMFLHYIIVNNLICYYDYYIGIPITNNKLFALHLIIIFVFMIITLKLYLMRK